MRRWLIWTGRLYPERWRARYGDEFAALLEETHPGWRECLDVVKGALTMQITRGTGFWKLAAGLAVVGALLAVAVAPRQYVTTAVLRISSATDPHLGMMKDEILSTGQLAAFMQQPKLDLYKEDRGKNGVWAAVEQMRRDLRIEWSGERLTISFAYPDAAKARLSTDQLARRFCESSIAMSRNRARLLQQFSADFFRNHSPEEFPLLAKAPTPVGMETGILQPASAPERDSAKLLEFGAYGLLLGMIAALAIRRPVAALQVAACAAVGFGVALLSPATYTSIAQMRITPEKIPSRLSGITVPPLTETMQKAEQEILSDSSLQQMLADPRLELHFKDAAALRDAIRLDPPRSRAFQVAFTYTDPLGAKRGADYLIAKIFEASIVAQRGFARASRNDALLQMEEHIAGENMEVLDPASLPVTPNAGYRWLFAIFGATVGLILAAVWPRRAWRASRVRVPGNSNLLFVRQEPRAV